MVESVTSATAGIVWWAGPNKNSSFEADILMHESVSKYKSALASVTKDLKPRVRVYIQKLSQYNFLWKEDMQKSHSSFMAGEPGMTLIRKEVEHLLDIERKISSVPSTLSTGSVVLCPNPVRDALQGLAAAWKTQYAMVLHEDAKKKLDSVVQYRNNIQNRLAAPVTTLDQLNNTLGLLEEIHEMENKIDDIYLPIEIMYEKLMSYDLRLARAELKQVEFLRHNWADLVLFADNLGQTLVKERRMSFEQELDKQLKTFVVEVIQFRNGFDAQGPAVPGVRPAEAVQRLHEFQNRYTLYNAKRKTLDSVQRLFGIPPKPFVELEKTGEELKLLGMLYGLFQKFIAFDKKIRETLWEGVDLFSAHNEVQGYWEECLNLPGKLKEWDAYSEMKSSINFYLDVLPLLHRLAKKGKFKDIMIPEIRNRHWLQVMSVTNSKFQLEANLFKLGHLLDIGLLKHKDEIRDIAIAASKELELEVKMRSVEEEWTEQVLTFSNYKRRGPVLLVKEDSERLLEQLEDAQALLANMLTSKHIGPLREEAASWAEKLKGVGEVLDLWLETQDLWLDLEAVFSDHITSKELPQEAKRFSMVDKSYVKLVRRAFDTKNILQCCYGGEVPKGVVLRHMQEELEICFKCLTQYLDKKRQVCPRFYFLTDPALLALLSRPNDIESVRPHLRNIFSSITDIKVEKSTAWSDTVSSLKSAHNTPTPVPPREEQRSGNIRFRSGMKSCDSPHYSASTADEMIDAFYATAVLSSNKEYLTLDDEVGLYDGVELWLQNLQESVQRSLDVCIGKAVQDVESNMAIEELAYRYPGQVARLGLLYLWTKECENAIAELKWDRKAFQNVSKKFTNVIARFPLALNRGTWKGIDEPVLPVHKIRLESMILYSVYLRDTMEAMSARKIREFSDFEWRRSIRFYSKETSGLYNHQIIMLDGCYGYGMEFYGTSPGLIMTPSTERAFVSMSIALQDTQGCALQGETCSGKTETVQGLAALLGRFLFLLSCDQFTDVGSLSKIMQGLTTHGSWGCFDDVQLLPSKAMSVLLEFTSSVFSTLKSKNKEQAFVSCLGNKGQLINVHQNVAFFLTFNPTAATPVLSTSVRSFYRTLCLSKPDFSAILKGYSTALGLRAPKALSDRLKTVYELSHQQIWRQGHHEVNLPAILFAANIAIQKRKARDERIESRAGEDMKMSRSNSQTSVRQPLPQASPSPSVVRPPVSEKVQAKKATTSPNTLSSQAKIDHGFVAQALLETISPGLVANEHVIFNNIVRDVFSGIQYVRDLLTSMSGTSPNSSSTITSAAARNHDLETAINQVVQERGLIANSNFVNKVLQLNQMASMRQGVVVAGSAGTGKSVIVSVLVDALCLLPHHHGTGRATSPGMSSHKLQRLYPMTVDDVSLMFGNVNHSNEWVDGILTHAWRKANRNQSTTWLCLDGPLVTSWADHFNSALDSHRVLGLSNGEKLQLSSNMRILFETSNLRNASPSLLARTGLVYIDKQVLGWRPIAQAWLATRSKEEVLVLQKVFNKTLDAVCAFVFHESRLKIAVCEVGLFSTCLSLLSEMLNEHQQHIGGDLHVERLFLFCLVWAFGGLLEGTAIKAFSDLLKTLSSALPDYDHEISVFDYYVDESGEWDSWSARVPEATYTGTTDILGEVFVDTADTIRVRSLLEFAHMAHKHTLIIGESGIGKTALINDFLDTQDKQWNVLRRLVFSHATTASQLHNFIHHNIQHRQGFVYGAKDGKYLEVFIDDLNLPGKDGNDIQRCNELLRAMLDDSMICKLTKPFEWRTVEGLEILATLSTSSVDFNIDPRLLRHFAVLRLRTPCGSELRNIIFSVLEANLSDKPLGQEILESISQASCKLLEFIKDVLRPCPMPGRGHYAFCLRQITKMCQCLRRVSEEERANDILMISLWKHEMERIVGDQMCRTADLIWFEEHLNKVHAETFAHYMEAGKELLKYFVTFPVEAKLHHRAIASSNHSVKVQLHPINEPKDTLECLKAHCTQYNEDQQHGRHTLDNVMFSDDMLCHVIRMHRVLSYHHGGSMVIVGAVGSHLTQLTHLALHVADLRPIFIDPDRPTSFFDSFRTAIRIAGTEGQSVSVLLSARELSNPMFLDTINSLLISGEYPHLFSNDEMDGLLQVLSPTLRRHYPNMMSDPMKFFVSRVKCNLHVVLILPPHHPLIMESLQKYPGIVSESQLIWIRDWPQEVLVQQAEYFINFHRVAHDTSHKTREALTMAIANMHSLTLRDCKQTSWAGDTNNTVAVTSTSLQTKKDKESIKVEKMEMPNLPYSKNILMERIKLANKDINRKSSVEVFVGPYTYRKFMELFNQLYINQSKLLEEETDKLQRTLETLDETRKDAKTMQKAIQVLRSQYKSSEMKVNELFTLLTTEATKLEKLKASFGSGGGSLHAFLQLSQDADSDYEEDTLLKLEEHDEYDRQFDLMREANLKSKRVQVDENIAAAKKNLDDCRQSLATAKHQVEHWRIKVDRGCIERLKAFKKPPKLVAQVLEMVMVLVGARPWLTGSRADQQSHGGRDVKTPRPSKRPGDHHDGSDKSSRVSSGSTLRTVQQKPQKAAKLSRQLTRNSGLSHADKGEAAVGKSKWKTMQNFMNDTVRFVEMIHSVDWETGLDQEILQEVETYILKGKEGQEGVTGEGSLLQESQATIQQKKSTTQGITISAARYSSEDAAVLVEYVISIVEYTRRCGPLRLAIDVLSQLEQEREKIQLADAEDQKLVIKSEGSDVDVSSNADGNHTNTSIEGLSKENIEQLQAEVDTLQEKYDEAVVKKHRLKEELMTSQERLRSALNTLENLRPLERCWKNELEEKITKEELVTNCVLAAAYLTYCGGMTSDARNRMTSFYTHVCRHYELPIPNKMLFTSQRLHEFLCSAIDVQAICIKKLPTDPSTLDQTCLLTSQHPTWCLICDPTAKAIDWLGGYLEERLVIVNYSDLKAHFETSLSEGNALLITYCDVMKLSRDERFREVLRRRQNFQNMNAPFKIMVGDHEVECAPSFVLYLHTATLPQDVPAEIAAYTTLVYNQTTRDGVRLELLDRFMRLEKPRLREEWMSTQRDKLKIMKVLHQLDEQLKETLAGDSRLLNDIQVTNKLAEIKKDYDEATETQSKIDVSEQLIERGKEGFNDVAMRGAVLYDVTRVMLVVNSLYHFSWPRFLSLYDVSIHQSEHASLKVVCSEMTYSIYSAACRSLFERDRLLFALFMVLEIEDSNGNVNLGEREYLISPDYGHAVMNAMGCHLSETRGQAKKAFDWMGDDQFHNLQILAMYHDWFHDLFDRMPRDGRELQWRLLCEGDSPELQGKYRLPDNADDNYTALQRLLVIRAIRNDRVVQASLEFIGKVLGRKYVKDEAPDLNAALKQSAPKTPILLVFTNENQLALNMFTEFSTKREVKYEALCLSGCEEGESRKARKSLNKAMEEGYWLMLHHTHNNPRLIQTIFSNILENNNIQSNFRLWLSSDATCTSLPTSLMHASVRLIIDVPKGMKDNLLRFASTHLTSDVINTSSRPEWLPCLHNVCLLHGAIQLRSRFPSCAGWQESNAFKNINYQQLKAAVAVVTREFLDIQSGGNFESGTNIMLKNISWTGLRYQIGELIYGSYVTNSYDQHSLNSLVDYWFASSSVKKEFELPRVKYRLPSVLFAPSVKQSAIVQAIDSVPQHSLDVAEACNLHPSTEATLGDDQYIFTRLNNIYDSMPESNTLSHKLYPRPPTAMCVPPQTSISNSSSHPWVIQRGVFASHSHALLKNRKEVELWEVCYNALPKISKTWSKEYVNERVRKLGGATPFNLFIQNELKQLQILLTEIKRGFMTIKSAVETLDQFGSRLSSDDVTIANDLSRSRVPGKWMRLAGDTAPPPNTSLSQWLNDIGLRVNHFERILAVGKDKIAAYWLGAFFNPHALVSVLKQEAVRSHIEKSGNVDNIAFHIEVTQRDKDHLRDPPSEGFFLHGVYLWGCSWDKTSGEMLDAPPKHGPIPLPVIHVTFTTESQKYGVGNETAKVADYYSCPVFVSCSSMKEPVFELDVNRDTIPSSRWALRGLTATVRPY